MFKTAFRYPALFPGVKNGDHYGSKRIIYEFCMRIAAFVAINREYDPFPQVILDIIIEMIIPNPEIMMAKSDFIRENSSRLILRTIQHARSVIYNMRKMRQVWKNNDVRQIVGAGGRYYEIINPEHGFPLTYMISTFY